MDHVSTVAANPLLARVRIPGQTFPLPSGGMFYKNGELAPNCENGEVHVYPMTGIDEVVMKSVDKVFSGQAIKEVFARCIPDVLKAGDLSAKDVDYLLVALRKVTYGSEIEVTFTHDCAEAKQHNYDVSLDTFLQRTKAVNPVTMRDAFEYKLENGQVVKFKPATYDDIIKVYQQQHQDSLTGDDVPAEVTLQRSLDSIAVLIGGVDEVTDREQIVQWLGAIPIMWVKAITDKVQATTAWGVTFEVDIVCKDCKERLTVPTPMNPISLFI